MATVHANQPEAPQPNVVGLEGKKAVANGSGAEHPTAEATAQKAAHEAEVPNLEELPKDKPAESNRPSAAAASEKFKTGQRRDPNAEVIPLKKRLTNLPVRGMPHNEWFVRVSNNAEHRGTLPIFWDKGGEGVGYLIDGEAHNYLNAKDNDCVLAITKQGSLFLWCSPLEGSNGKWNDWHQSAFDMKEIAADNWIASKGNKQISG